MGEATTFGEAAALAPTSGIFVMESEKEAGRHQGMDRPGGRQVPAGSGVHRKNGGNRL